MPALLLLLLAALGRRAWADHIPTRVFAGDGFTDVEFEGSRASTKRYDRRTPDVADKIHDNVRCDERVGKHHTACYRDYERCKDTHRCNRAEVDYNVTQARLDFFERTFNGGRRFDADMFYDFEDWVIGSHKFTQGPYVRGDVLGFSTFSSPTIGSLEFRSGTVWINTTSLEMRLVHGCRDIEPDVDGVEEANCTRSGRALESITYQGAVHMTRGYTEVATFNFERVYLGRWVKVHTTGSRALSLLSRSSMIIDCPIVVEPGTLGGFPGGRLPRDFNFNGPGSGSVRVFEKTITTRAPNVDEVQRITTYATPGENIAGGFTLKYCRGANSKAVQCDVSERIPFDATAAGLKNRIESAFRYAGQVEVARQGPDAQKAFIWTVTFTSATDVVPQLEAKSYLTGSGAMVTVETLTEGNTISGWFNLEFMGAQTRVIPHDITSGQVRHTLPTSPIHQPRSHREAKENGLNIFSPLSPAHTMTHAHTHYITCMTPPPHKKLRPFPAPQRIGRRPPFTKRTRRAQRPAPRVRHRRMWQQSFPSGRVPLEVGADHDRQRPVADLPNRKNQRHAHCRRLEWKPTKQVGRPATLQIAACRRPKRHTDVPSGQGSRRFVRVYVSVSIGYCISGDVPRSDE